MSDAPRDPKAVKPAPALYTVEHLFTVAWRAASMALYSSWGESSKGSPSINIAARVVEHFVDEFHK